MTDLFQEVKQKLDLVEVISEHLELAPSGPNRKVGFCPFHANFNTPVLTVYPDQQSWYCYGCQAGGDVLDFLTLVEKEDMGTVIRKQAQKLGIALRNLSRKERRKLEQDNRLYAVTKDAEDLFHVMLLWDTRGASARRYLEQRGITSETIITFQLGYAPNDWGWITRKLLKKGHTREDIILAGLARKKQGKDSAYDYFRDRIIFPTRNNGNTLGFGGRQLNPGQGPKYLNSPTTPIFKKQEILYGFPQALFEMKVAQSVTLVEGYMDVLALHQQGFKNTVGIMGIFFSEAQAKLLSKHVNRAVLALDPDEAAEASLGRLRVEALSELDIYVSLLQGNRDPDEIVLESPAEWEDILAEAQPIPIYMTDYLIDKFTPNDPKERRNVAKMVMPLINIVKDPFEQAGYQEYLADALGYTNYRPNPKCPHCGKPYYGDHK
jgi:DNA primase